MKIALSYYHITVFGVPGVRDFRTPGASICLILVPHAYIEGIIVVHGIHRFVRQHAPEFRPANW